MVTSGGDVTSCCVLVVPSTGEVRSSWIGPCEGETFTAVKEEKTVTIDVIPEKRENVTSGRYSSLNTEACVMCIGS